MPEPITAQRLRDAARDSSHQYALTDEVLGHLVSTWIDVATRPGACGETLTVLGHVLLDRPLPAQLSELQAHLLDGFKTTRSGRSRTEIAAA